MNGEESDQTIEIEKPLPAAMGPPQVRGKKTLLKMRSPLNTAIASAVSSIPDFILAGILLRIWLFRSQNGTSEVHWALILVLMEFVVMHSAAMMGGLIELDMKSMDPPMKRWHKLPLFLFLCAFYSVFAYLFGSWPAMQGFLLLCLNRALPVITGRVFSEEEKKRATDNYATAGVLFIVAIFLGIILWVPDEMIRSREGTGDTESYRMIVTGVLYYAMHALIKICPAIEFVRGPLQYKARERMRSPLDE